MLSFEHQITINSLKPAWMLEKIGPGSGEEFTETYTNFRQQYRFPVR